MRIAVIGTGMVGRALAGRLAELGHDVVVGTRNVKQTLARSEPDMFGTPPISKWLEVTTGVRLVNFAEAGVHGELVINATRGTNALDSLAMVGAENLSGKVLLDVAVPLDFSQGMPPLLSVANTDSLGEQIQRAYPDVHVVKSLNTVFVEVMINPARVPGRHNIFISGEDSNAKNTVQGLLTAFGWPAESILDLGGIRAARGTEMYMALYWMLYANLGTFDFNIATVKA